MDKKKLLLICIFTGIFGGHYFVTGKVKKGFLYLFTAGLFGIGWITDIVTIATSDNFLEKVEARDQKKLEGKQAVQVARQAETEKLKNYRKEGVPYCPRCHSTHVTAQKRGFSVGKGLLGSAVVLPLGAVTGAVGKNKIEITCLNCGNKFRPGRKF